jgi:hypothetical protein
LIEVLIAIVLMGLAVTATMTTLTATITATSLDRDHANAHAWLQTGVDMLYAQELINCGAIGTDNDGDSVTTASDSDGVMTTFGDVKNDYQSTLRQTDNPEGWPDANIEVIDLQFWNIEKLASGLGTEAWSTSCDNDTTLQRLLVRVRGADGRIVEETEVIIGG